MKYLGSKNKISKYLKPIIESYLTEDKELYIEPFVGGANMIDKISFNNKVGMDINEYLIELLNYVKDENNELPFDISEEEYIRVRDNKESYDKWYVGLVGFCATFGSKWFGGYARAFKSDKVTPRNMSNEAIRNIEKQRINLKDIKFIHNDYLNIEDLNNAVIYCDIPYKSATGYKDEFNHERFYEWCRNLKNKNNIILISEYDMPNDFVCIWEKEHTTIVGKSEGKHDKRLERLFLIK